MNGLFNVMQQHFRGFFEPLWVWLVGVLWIIVLLHSLRVLALRVTNWGPYTLFQNFLIKSSVHVLYNNYNISKSWSKVPSEAQTIALPPKTLCRCDHVFVKCCITFIPDDTGLRRTKFSSLPLSSIHIF